VEPERGPDLSVKLGEFQLSNPVMAASGTFGYGLEYAPFVDLNRLGGFATKGLSLKPRLGNPVPRMIETASGMLNAIGLENIGLEKFVQEKIPRLQGYKTRVVVNFFGDTMDEYVEMAEALSGVERVDALEMNISCPNVEQGGVQFSSDADTVNEVVAAARKATDKFLIVKLSPNVTDITEIAIKPIALQMVYKTSRAVSVPIIGIGGIASTGDALEFLLAGASAIQIGTANFFDPAVTMKVIEGLQKYCEAHGLKSLADLKILE
jgi:dihydroorotate dehydrogenase (NAD+) catalytic subunit